MPKKATPYVVNINRIGSKGSFLCPHKGCGVTINPEDESGIVYEIRDSNYRDEELESLTLGCLKCGSEIKLIGFLDKRK